MNTCDVAVVGAGSVGVAAALAFARAGKHVVLLDPRPPAATAGPAAAVADDDWDSRVFALSPASVSLLSSLGVWSRMDMQRVAPVHDMRLFHDQDGGSPQESLRLDAWQGQIEQLAFIVEGRHLQRALDQAATDAAHTLRLQRVQGTVTALSLPARAQGQPDAAGMFGCTGSAAGDTKHTQTPATSRPQAAPSGRAAHAAPHASPVHAGSAHARSGTKAQRSGTHATGHARRGAHGPSPEHAARLTLASGEVWQAGLVVAADGARSALREMAGLEARFYDYGQTAVVANFNSALPTRDAAWQWFDADLGVMALLPLTDIGRPAGQGRVSLVWSAPVEWAAALQAMSPEALAAQVAHQSRGALGELQCITPAAAFPLRSVSCPRVIAPGFVMIGDAAHVVHPMAGQGMNLGFGDVQALVDTLAQPVVGGYGHQASLAASAGAQASSGTGYPSRALAGAHAVSGRTPADPDVWRHGAPLWLALRRYERARREPVATMQSLMLGLHHVFGPALPPPLAALRNLGWQAVGASGWLSRQLIQRAIR